MRKKLVCMLPVMVAVLMCGCGKTSSPVISLSDYNAIVEERNIAQAKVAELKESTVSKSDYDKVVSERDELKSKVAELEAAAAKASEEEKKVEEDKKAEEDKQEVKANEPGIYGDIHYVVAPVTVENVYGQRWEIEKFEITGLSKNGNNYNMDYICAGTGGRGVIDFFCYDKDGYKVGSFGVIVETNSSTDKFKVQARAYGISSETVRIDIE